MLATSETYQPTETPQPMHPAIFPGAAGAGIFPPIVEPGTWQRVELRDPGDRSSSEGVYRLAVEVVAQAVKDALGRGATASRETAMRDARTWLASPDAELFLTVAKVDPSKMRAWIDRGCPAPDQARRGNK